MKVSMRRRGENGQALILVVVAMGIVLIGALGLAIDGAQMYGHRQMAQVAADAAAQAGIMSIFNDTNTAGAAAFSTSGAFTCTTSDAKGPCQYAAANGFGGTAADTVTIDFPGSGAVPGVTLSTVDPVTVIRATVQRTLNTGLIRFLGPSTSTVRAIAIAAIVDVVAPVPILVTHPTLPGALSSNGNPTMRICGGPQRSIQVNSTSSTAVSLNSNTTVDLSKAGPLDSGTCTTGTGADFGDRGGPSAIPTPINVGTTGHYIQPAAVILDPLASVPAPAQPGTAGTDAPLANGVSGCPVAPAKPCGLYSPGNWNGGIDCKNETCVFKPGLYYMNNGGFGNHANGLMLMATGFAADPNTGAGMVVYSTGTGTFAVGSNSNATLVGSDAASIYKGILFFQDRSSAAKSHSLGGGGNLSLKGTIYLTNTVATMTGTPTHYQALTLQGNSGNTTYIEGEIIVGTLSLGGTPNITMNLNAAATLHIRQVALVK